MCQSWARCFPCYYCCTKKTVKHDFGADYEKLKSGKWYQRVVMFRERHNEYAYGRVSQIYGDLSQLRKVGCCVKSVFVCMMLCIQRRKLHTDDHNRTQTPTTAHKHSPTQSHMIVKEYRCTQTHTHRAHCTKATLSSGHGSGDALAAY